MADDFGSFAAGDRFDCGKYGVLKVTSVSAFCVNFKLGGFNRVFTYSHAKLARYLKDHVAKRLPAKGAKQ